MFICNHAHLGFIDETLNFELCTVLGLCVCVTQHLTFHMVIHATIQTFLAADKG